MKTRTEITLLVLVCMLLSACGGAPTSEVPLTSQIPASQTPGPMASVTPAPTLTALPSPTSTIDPTQDLLEQQRQDLRTYLEEPIEAAIAANGGDWFIMLQEMDGETLYTRQADTPVWVDNLIHLPITALFLKSIEDSGVTEMKVYLTVNRNYETSLRQTLYEMLVYGDETSSASILSTIPKYGMHINQVFQDWNMTDTSLPNKMASAQDLVSLLDGLASRSLLSEESTILIYDMLDQGEKNDNSLYIYASEGAGIHDQQVSVSTVQAMLGELAVVAVGGSTYLLAILGFGSDKQPASYAQLAQTYDQVAQSFWRYVGSR